MLCICLFYDNFFQCLLVISFSFVPDLLECFFSLSSQPHGLPLRGTHQYHSAPALNSTSLPWLRVAPLCRQQAMLKPFRQKHCRYRFFLCLREHWETYLCILLQGGMVPHRTAGGVMNYTVCILGLNQLIPFPLKQNLETNKQTTSLLTLPPSQKKKKKVLLKAFFPLQGTDYCKFPSLASHCCEASCQALSGEVCKVTDGKQRDSHHNNECGRSENSTLNKSLVQSKISTSYKYWWHWMVSTGRQPCSVLVNICSLDQTLVFSEINSKIPLDFRKITLCFLLS